MLYIAYGSSFQKAFSRLKRKYRNIEKDIQPLLFRLENGNFSHDSALPGFEGLVYKARVASSDQGRGKRGGFRIVYYCVTEKQEVRLLTIYAKAQQENISPQEIRQLLANFDD